MQLGNWVGCRSGDIPVYTAAPGNAAVYTAVYTAAPRYILQYIPRRRGIFRECQYMVACVPVFGNRFFFFTCTVVFDLLIPFILKFSTISSQAQK